jgi:hypothetical protein
MLLGRKPLIGGSASVIGQTSIVLVLDAFSSSVPFLPEKETRRTRSATTPVPPRRPRTGPAAREIEDEDDGEDEHEKKERAGPEACFKAPTRCRETA